MHNEMVEPSRRLDFEPQAEESSACPRTAWCVLQYGHEGLCAPTFRTADINAEQAPVHRGVLKGLLLFCLLGCGAPDAFDVEGPDAGAPAVEAGGEVRPYLSVNGTSSPRPNDPDWYPTGVAFDSRTAGWRLSCLNGRQPYLSASGDRFMELRCPDEVLP